MSYSTTIQLTLFNNLDAKGKVSGKPQYGYRIYSDYGETEYSNVYDSVPELLNEISTDTALDFIKENHPDFYETIRSDGGFYFNDEIVFLAEDDDENVIIDCNYDTDNELFDGDEDIEKEVEEVLEEAADLLI